MVSTCRSPSFLLSIQRSSWKRPQYIARDRKRAGTPRHIRTGHEAGMLRRTERVSSVSSVKENYIRAVRRSNEDSLGLMQI
jgi:hypothetical protein